MLKAAWIGSINKIFKITSRFCSQLRSALTFIYMFKRLIAKVGPWLNAVQENKRLHLENAELRQRAGNFQEFINMTNAYYKRRLYAATRKPKRQKKGKPDG